LPSVRKISSISLTGNFSPGCAVGPSGASSVAEATCGKRLVANPAVILPPNINARRRKRETSMAPPLRSNQVPEDSLFTRSSVEVFTVGLRICAGRVDHSVSIVRRCIQRVELERNVPGVDDVSIRSGWEEHRDACADRRGNAIENSRDSATMPTSGSSAMPPSQSRRGRVHKIIATPSSMTPTAGSAARGRTSWQTFA